MLDHRDPTIICGWRWLGLPLGNVLEVELVELLFVRISSRACERIGAEHRACGHRAVTHQLQIELRVTWLIAHVDDLVANADRIASAVEDVGLDVLQTTDGLALEGHFKRVLTIDHLTRA